MGSKTRRAGGDARGRSSDRPGATDPVADLDGVLRLGEELGYLLIVKAAGGGGGKAWSCGPR